MRQEFPRAVRVARLKHATKDGVLCCEDCGVMLKRPAEYAFDHDNPDGLTGKPTFENCRVLCVAVCHSEKTKRDQADIAEAKRRSTRRQARTKAEDRSARQASEGSEGSAADAGAS